MSNTTPMLNQTSGDKHTLPSALDAWIHSMRIDWDQCLPAKVISFDRANNVAVVQPLIQWVLTDKTSKSRGQLVQIPVLSMGGGGFHISFPLKMNDIGWIHASDRDLSLFKQTLTESTPPISRMHSFEDGMFIPDVFRQYTVASEDDGAMVVQSTDGATKISIREDNILIAATTKVMVRVPLTEFSQDVQIDGNLVVAKNTTITGQTAANGGFTSAEGTACSLPSSTTVANKAVDGHIHGPGNYNNSAGQVNGDSSEF